MRGTPTAEGKVEFVYSATDPSFVLNWGPPKRSLPRPSRGVWEILWVNVWVQFLPMWLPWRVPSPSSGSRWTKWAAFPVPDHAAIDERLELLSTCGVFNRLVIETEWWTWDEVGGWLAWDYV
jgi:hypothetical protein